MKGQIYRRFLFIVFRRKGFYDKFYIIRAFLLILPNGGIKSYYFGIRKFYALVSN